MKYVKVGVSSIVSLSFVYSRVHIRVSLESVCDQVFNSRVCVTNSGHNCFQIGG